MSQQRIRQIIEEKARMEGGLQIGGRGGAMRKGMDFGGCYGCPMCGVPQQPAMGGARKLSACGPGRTESALITRGPKKGQPYIRNQCVQWSNDQGQVVHKLGDKGRIPANSKCSKKEMRNYSRCVRLPRKETWRIAFLKNEYNNNPMFRGSTYGQVLQYYRLGNREKGQLPGPGAQQYIDWKNAESFPVY